MQRHWVYVLVTVLLCLGGKVTAYEQAPLVQLVALLRHTAVVILGETHHRTESLDLTVATVAMYLQGGGCLTVALEIAAEEQGTLEAALHGAMPLAAVRIHPLIDHPAYRAMLRTFREFIQAGWCLSVQAVDAPQHEPGARDAWMAQEIEALVSSGPVLVLVGNLHALKHIHWASGTDAPFLAERLLRRELQVQAILQEWEPGCEAWSGYFLEMPHPRAVAALEATLGVAAVQPLETPETIVDGVVVWECGVETR